MAHAVAGLPENVTSRSQSRDRSRSCSRSRHHTPERLPASPALDSPSWSLSQSSLQKAASKSPRAMSCSLLAAWQSPRTTAVKTPHAVSRSPRAVGRNAAASGINASSIDAKPKPAEGRDQRPGRSASLARLQRSHKSAATQKGFTSLVKDSTCQAGHLQAEDQETRHARAGSGGIELAVTAPQSGGVSTRGLSGSAGPELLPSTSSHDGLRVQDCLLQRSASSPPMSMLSRGPFHCGGPELHRLSCAGLPFTDCPLGRPALQQQQQQAGLQPQPHQEEQQQQWLVQQQQWQQQQRQQQLPAACSGLQQPAAIHLEGQLQNRTAWASGPGVAQDNLGSSSAGVSHSMLAHPQHQQQHQQTQQAELIAAQLPILPMPTRIQLDYRHSAAAALHTASLEHTDGKQAATAAECKGRRTMPGANVHSLWGHSKQLGSCVIQNQEVLHPAAHEHAPLAQQQPSDGPIPLPVHQPACLAPGLDCACEMDEALQVQKLNVTPHKTSRQLSGNPFAEPAQMHSPTQHVTTQTQHAQHVPASGHAAGLTHPAQHTPTHIASAQPSSGSHDSHLMAEHCHDACCVSAAALTSGNAAAPDRQRHQADDTQRPSEVTGMAVPSPSSGEWPVPIAAVGSLAGAHSTVSNSSEQVAGDQTGRLLQCDLEIEAVAADAEACLLELQVWQLFTS